MFLPFRSKTSPVLIEWHVLQEGLAELLPEGVLHFGYDIQSLHQDEEGVTLNFKVKSSFWPKLNPKPLIAFTLAPTLKS